MSKGRVKNRTDQLKALQRSLDLLWEGHDAETVRFKTNSAERENRKQARRLSKAMRELLRAVHGLVTDDISINNLDPALKKLGPETTQLQLDIARQIIIKRIVDALGKVIFALLPAKRKEIEQRKSKNRERKRGAQKTNVEKALHVDQRRQKISEYLARNPNPNTKGLKLAAHLNKQLNLKVSERTIKRDLKKLFQTNA